MVILYVIYSYILEYLATHTDFHTIAISAGMTCHDAVRSTQWAILENITCDSLLSVKTCESKLNYLTRISNKLKSYLLLFICMNEIVVYYAIDILNN